MATRAICPEGLIRDEQIVTVSSPLWAFFGSNTDNKDLSGQEKGKVLSPKRSIQWAVCSIGRLNKQPSGHSGCVTEKAKVQGRDAWGMTSEGLSTTRHPLALTTLIP